MNYPKTLSHLVVLRIAGRDQVVGVRRISAAEEYPWYRHPVGVPWIKGVVGKRRRGQEASS
jgi:hypothetical protein